MKITDIVTITKGRTNKKYIDREIREISLDSREISNGDVFVCVNNGINYIADAINNGAIAIIIDRNISDFNIPIIYVENVITSIGILGKYIREKYYGKVIAITGSNGKTTTKELISHILSTKNKVLKNIGSENNFIGVPKTLFKLNNSYDYLVIEIGMNHLGEIEYLSKMIKPDIGIITNIGTAHIGLLGNKENIFIAKSEIILGNPDMELYINGEDEYLKRLDGIKIYTNDYNNIFINKHCPIDYVIATKVCEKLGYNLKEIMESLKNFKLPNSRMKEITINNRKIIDDSYNASYESIIEGLKSLNRYNGRKIVILGDMLELGNYSKKIHQKIINEINTNQNILLFTIGEKTREIASDNNFTNNEELKEYFDKFIFRDNDVLYLKGSHKMQLYSLVPYFEERLK